MNAYLVTIVAVLIVKYLITSTVNILNVKAASPALPEEFKDVYDSPRYRKSQMYLKDKTFFEITFDTFFLLVLLLLILSGAFNWIDVTARSFGFGEVLTGLLFAFILFLFFQTVHLPFQAYETFIIEEKYGFNRTTIGVFVSDILKKLVLTSLIGGVIFAFVIQFFIVAGDLAWFYCWITVVAAELFVTYIAPVAIMPMFNKFTPLESGPLKEKINSYVDSEGYKLKGIYKIDASRRSSKSNAFFTGFGRYKRVALFDTLLETHTDEELVAILAHEIGHYRKGHITRMILFSIINTGIMFYLLSLFINSPGLFSAFGIEKQSIYAGMAIFSFLYIPISFVMSVAANIMSRRFEFEADRYTLATYGKPEAMADALKKLTVGNLSNLTPHPAKVFLEYSHPPVLQRIRAVQGAR